MTDTPTIAALNDIAVERGGRRILSIPQLSLPKGKTVALIGPNGSGKTTLLKLLHGLIDAESGRVAWGGGLPPARAILLQTPVLLRRPARENVTFILKRRGLSGPELRQETDALLSRANLGDHADTQARVLSGGQQRRLALAQALAREPDMLLLDEPTAGLDPTAAVAVERMIREAADEGRSIVLSTHDIPQVRRLADMAVFLNRGLVTNSGATPDLLDNPPTQELTAFLNGDLEW